MRRHPILVLAVLFIVVGLSAAAAAVSPGVVRAVADRPLTLTLIDGSALQAEVVELGEESFIVIDGDGNVAELAYDEVISLQVRSASAAPPATQPPATQPPATQPPATQSEGYTAQSERSPSEGAAPVEEEEATGEGTEEETSGVSLYGRLGLNSGFGRLRRVTWTDEGEEVLRTRGLNLGFNAALGVRFGSVFAFHLSVGVQRYFRTSERSGWLFDDVADDYFRPVDYRVRLMTVAPGITLHFGGFLVSFSTGLGGTRVWGGELGGGTTEWDLGGDFLVGYASPISSSMRVGVGFSLNWVRIGDDEFGNRSAAAAFGPQLFMTY